MNRTSILVDASKYIQELKEKVERLNEEIGSSQDAPNQNQLPMVITCLLFYSYSFLFFNFAF